MKSVFREKGRTLYLTKQNNPVEVMLFWIFVLFYYSINLTYIFKILIIWTGQLWTFGMCYIYSEPCIRHILTSTDVMHADQRQISILSVTLKQLCLCKKARIHFILVNPSVIRPPQICHEYEHHKWKHTWGFTWTDDSQRAAPQLGVMLNMRE